MSRHDHAPFRKCFVNRKAWLGMALFPALAEVASSQESPDVAEVIVPFVEKHCVQCHGPKKQKAELALHEFQDERSILKARKTWMRVLGQLRDGAMPPEERPRPSVAEVERFSHAVGGVFARFDRSAGPNPGRVTMRRLNRTEYTNTVRDLVGVDVPVGDDLPADDVGHGFDNLGDFLTLSPLHLERYMALAERIMQQGIVVGEPPPPAIRQERGDRMQPSPKEGNNPRKLEMPDGARAIYDSLPQHAVFTDVYAAGEYKIVVHGQGRNVGDARAEFAILHGDKEVGRGSCGEKTGDNLEQDSATIRLKSGPPRIGVMFLNPSTGEDIQRCLIVHRVQLIGPSELDSHVSLLAAPPELKGEAKARHVLERFAARAYRRPPTPEELDRLMALFKRAEQISWYKLSDAACQRLKEAGLPEGLWNALNNNDKVRTFLDEDRFVRLLKERTKPENQQQFNEHREAILEHADRTPPPWEASIALVMRAVLCSPKFLFRPELDSRPTGDDPQPLDDYALASRLSYFLWSSMPDQELFDLAARSRLHQELPAQVKRMLADPRSDALFENFAMQWLRLRPLADFRPDPEGYPDFSPELRDDMIHETRLFFLEVLRENRSIFDLVDAKFTFLNERLASHYEIKDTNGNSSRPKAEPVNPPGGPLPRITGGRDDRGKYVPELSVNPFVRVSLENTPRGGLLTHASVLTVTSHPTRTSPVKRGKWVLEHLLGTPPPPPPPDVPELEEAKEETMKLSLRQQMERHREIVSCANCHARMDPIGLGLENFDALGRFREADGDALIDTAGELPGGERFSGPDELKQILKGKRDLIGRNLAEKLLIYATGRGLEYYDKPAVDGILAKLEKSEYRMQSLIIAVVRSDPFRMRQGKEQP